MGSFTYVVCRTGDMKGFTLDVENSGSTSFKLSLRMRKTNFGFALLPKDLILETENGWINHLRGRLKVEKFVCRQSTPIEV